MGKMEDRKKKHKRVLWAFASEPFLMDSSSKYSGFQEPHFGALFSGHNRKKTGGKMTDFS